MPTLSEYQKLEKDMVVAGIYQNLITADALTAMLSFKSFEGNSMVYNRENVLPTSSTHAVGDTWETTEPTFTKKTASLTIVGSQSGIDLFAAETLSSVQSQEAAVMSLMAKSLSRKIAQLVIQGEPEATATHWEGLDSLVRSESRMMAMDAGTVGATAGSAETELTLDRLDAMIDQIDDSQTKPDALIMNATMRRKLTALSRVPGSGVMMNEIDMFGHRVRTYDGIPMVTTNWITDEEQYNDSSTWTSSTATTIFAVQFGQEKEGYTLIHNGDVLTPRVRDLGVKRDAEFHEKRMVAYLQAVTFSSKKIAALGGIDSAA